MTKIKKRIKKQTTHHEQLIRQTRELLSYLCNQQGDLYNELKIVYPRGMGITGLKSSLKKVNKLLKEPYNEQ